MKKISVLIITAILICVTILAFSSCGNKSSDGDGGTHTHTMSEWRVESVADCVNDGKEVRSCTGEGCNHTERKTIPALGHDLKNVSAQAPDCVNAGHDTYQQCSRCSHSTYVELKALGHDYTIDPEKNPDGDTCVRCDQKHICSTYGAWYTTKEADCTTPGEESRKCTVCNAVDVQTTEKIDHDFDKDGKCTECGDVDSDAPELPGEEF